MIKINLVRSKVPVGGEGDAAAVAVDQNAFSNEIDQREILIKFVVMIIGVAGLWIYEKQNIDQLTSKNAVVQAQLNEMKKKVAEKQAELSKLKDIEPQAQMLNDKLKILREYSKLRLENLQSLDFLQSIIPERVWLRSIVYEARKYDVLGFAMDTIDLTDFVNKLEGSAYFADVIVIQDKENPVQGGKIRDFELTARAGMKN